MLRDVILTPNVTDFRYSPHVGVMWDVRLTGYNRVSIIIRDSDQNSRLHAEARVTYSSYLDDIQINFTSKIGHHNVNHFGNQPFVVGVKFTVTIAKFVHLLFLICIEFLFIAE